MVRLILTAVLIVPALALAAPPNQNPDWPCQQPLVREVTAATFWNGPLPAADGSAPSDPRIDKLAADVSSRDASPDEVKTRIAAFLQLLKPQERARIIPAAFVAIVADVNRQRGDIIDSIEDLTHRQRDIAQIVAKVSEEIAAIPADATGDAATKRDEAAQRKAFLVRTFEDTRKTMRYACEVPSQLDARLGAVAQQLQAALAPGGR